MGRKGNCKKIPRFQYRRSACFFIEAGWGALVLEKTTKDEAFYTMTKGDITTTENRSCQLEAGFVAEQFQKLNGFLTECYGEVRAKDGLVRFHVKWDVKTTI